MEGNIGIMIAVAVIGIAVGFVVKNFQIQNAIRNEEIEAGRIVDKAKKEAKEIEIQAKDSALEIRQRSENDIERKRKDLNRQDDRLQKRRADLDRQSERVEDHEQSLNKRQSGMDKLTNELDSRQEEILKRLEKFLR